MLIQPISSMSLGPLVQALCQSLFASSAVRMPVTDCLHSRSYSLGPTNSDARPGLMLHRCATLSNRHSFESTKQGSLPADEAVSAARVAAALVLFAIGVRPARGDVTAGLVCCFRCSLGGDSTKVESGLAALGGALLKVKFPEVLRPRRMLCLGGTSCVLSRSRSRWICRPRAEFSGNPIQDIRGVAAIS